MRRQRRWSERNKQEKEDGSTSFRPVPIHRVSAKHNAQWLDNQLRVMTSRPGLSFFKRQDDAEQWRDYRMWPGLGLSHDLGSDQLCMVYHLLYKQGLSMWSWPDPAHADKRDFDDLISELGINELSY